MAGAASSGAAAKSPFATIFLIRTVVLALNSVCNLYVGYTIMASTAILGYDFSANYLKTGAHLSPDLAALVQGAVQIAGAGIHGFGWAYLYGAMTSNIKEQSPVLLAGSISKGLAACIMRSVSQQLQQLNETASIQSALSGLFLGWTFDALMSLVMFVLYVAGHIASAAEKKRAAAPEKKTK